MKRLLLIVGLLSMLAVSIESFGRGFGGGGGGFHGGGFGGGGFGGGGFGGGGRSFGGGGFGGGGEFHGFTPSYGGGGFSRPSWGGAAYSRPSYIPQSRPSYSGNSFNSFDRFGGDSFARNNFAGDRSGFDSLGSRINSDLRPDNFNRQTINNPFDAGIGNRANINQNIRPAWDNGNRANIDNRTNIANRTNFNNNNFNINRNNWTNNINHWANNHPWNNHPWYNHYDHWHNNWHHGYWPYWGSNNYPWLWFGAGTLGWWGYPGTTYVYDNPFYVVSDDSGYSPDYAQPIPTPTGPQPNLLADGSSSTPAPNDGSDQSATYADSGDVNTQKAVAIFDAGRAMFKKGDYQGALDKVNQAIQLLPSDDTLHEFRAQCLFALKRYQESAAGIYAVLAAGPGWDWDTMKALYPNTETYTEQLRALEAYKKANPDKPDASFLLAYQYLVIGYPDSAMRELEQVVKLQPNDKLSAALLKALQDRNKPQEQQQAPPTPTAS